MLVSWFVNHICCADSSTLSTKATDNDRMGSTVYHSGWSANNNSSSDGCHNCWGGMDDGSWAMNHSCGGTNIDRGSVDGGGSSHNSSCRPVNSSNYGSGCSRSIHTASGAIGGSVSISRSRVSGTKLGRFR